MMATTQLDNIHRRSSCSGSHEFRTIRRKAIATKLREIVDKEGVTVGDDTLQPIAVMPRSMRDAESKLDSGYFTGKTISTG